MGLTDNECWVIPIKRYKGKSIEFFVNTAARGTNLIRTVDSTALIAYKYDNINYFWPVDMAGCSFAA